MKKTDSETFGKPEINTGTDRVETYVVSSSGTDSASYRHAAALCEPVFRLKMKFSKGFHSLEIMFQPRGSGAYKQVHSQNSLLCSVIAFCAGL